MAHNIVGDRRDAEECVNDAYLGIWNAIPPARPDPLRAYLVKVVRNLSLKAYWKREAAKRNSHYTVALEELEECVPGRETVEEELDAQRAGPDDRGLFGDADSGKPGDLPAAVLVL